MNFHKAGNEAVFSLSGKHGFQDFRLKGGVL